MSRRRPSRPSTRVQAAVAVLVVLVLLGRGLLAGAGDEPGSGSPSAGARSDSGPATGQFYEATVLEAIDGDTLTVRFGGRTQRVRLLGIDAPESTTLRSGHVECGGDAAKAFMRRLVSTNPLVDLRPDATQDAEDQYGRLLAYVAPVRSDGPTFQEQILRAGLARVYVYDRHPFARVGAFRAAAAAARQARAGVWSSCGGDFRRPVS